MLTHITISPPLPPSFPLSLFLKPLHQLLLFHQTFVFHYHKLTDIQKWTNWSNVNLTTQNSKGLLPNPFSFPASHNNLKQIKYLLYPQFLFPITQYPVPIITLKPIPSFSLCQHCVQWSQLPCYLIQNLPFSFYIPQSHLNFPSHTDYSIWLSFWLSTTAILFNNSSSFIPHFVIQFTHPSQQATLQRSMHHI